MWSERLSLRRWLPTAALAALAVASGLVLRQLETDEQLDFGARGHTPDFFMEDFQSTVLGLDGKPVRILRARQLLHFPDTQTRELDAPHLTLFHAERTPWNARSERGWVSAGGDVILMLGEAHAWRRDEAGAPLVDIHTRDMRILPDTEIGETDAPATVVTNGQQSDGVGMRAYMAESRIELMSRVRSVVTNHLSEPPQTRQAN